MTENEKISEVVRLLEGIDTDYLRRREVAGAAALVESAIGKLKCLLPPAFDVQQGPSGFWYRVMPSGDGDVRIRQWRTEAGARKAIPVEWTGGIVPGDEATVAELLTRHAQRAAAERLP